MRQKLFKKYFFATAALFLASLFFVMLILVFIFNNHLSNTKYETLSKTCNSVVEYIDDSSNFNQDTARNLFNTVSTIADVEVFITNAEGKIFLCGCEDCATGGKCEKTGKTVSKNILKKAELVETTDFSTLNVYDTARFSVAKPYFDNSGKTVAIVFSTTSTDSVRQFLITVFRFFLFSALIPIIIVFFALYFMSYRMIRPLKLMSEASKAMAKGDFSKRIPVTSDDEIGELAVSFNMMTNSLTQLEGMRRSFVANVSHELKTPMTTIGGFIDGIIDGTIEKDKQSYYLNIVSDEVKRLSRLVQSMLSMSKLESGEYVLKKEIFDLRELLCTIVISQEQQIEKQKIDILGLDAIKSVSINADKDLIYQVIYNLVDNAIKFTGEEGKITFELTANGKYANLKISNTGKGIPEAELPFVFERFYKVDKSRSANKNSTGLGLYIAKNIISAHSGRITVSSRENVITTFLVELPM